MAPRCRTVPKGAPEVLKPQMATPRSQKEPAAEGVALKIMNRLYMTSARDPRQVFVDLGRKNHLRGDIWEETFEEACRGAIWEEASEERHLGREIWDYSGKTWDHFGYIWDHLG